MFDAVQCFPRGSAPRLSAGAQDYEVVEGPEHGKIVRYVDPSSREPVHSLSYGYVTAFTYMHCQEIGKLSEVDVRENVKLQPSCGTFSYSEIPSFYQCCLGMTGTLDCKCSSSACVCTQSADSHVMARNKGKESKFSHCCTWQVCLRTRRSSCANMASNSVPICRQRSPSRS